MFAKMRLSGTGPWVDTTGPLTVGGGGGGGAIGGGDAASSLYKSRLKQKLEIANLKKALGQVSDTNTETDINSRRLEDRKRQLNAEMEIARMEDLKKQRAANQKAGTGGLQSLKRPTPMYSYASSPTPRVRRRSLPGDASILGGKKLSYV